MAYDPNEVQAYIRDAAARRGIDPGTALRVFKQESSFNPEARNISDREESYGVAQLNAKGGLGVHALQKGINIRDPATWRAQMDFALDTVAKVGWGQWYGARDIGIGKWDGIGGRPPAGAGRAPGGVSNRALSPTSVAQQFVPSGTPAPAAFGDVVASNVVQTEAVRLSFGQIAQTFFADRRAAQEERRNEEEAEASRKAALFGGSLFGLYG